MPGAIKFFVRWRLCSLAKRRETGKGGHHHARKKLHGRDVALGEGMRRAGENFEDPESSAEVAQRRSQDGADSQALADRDVDMRIVLRIMAEYDLAGAHAIGGNAGIRLQTNAQVRRGAPGAGPAHHFIALAQGDRRSACAGERFRPLGNQADGGLQVNVRRKGYRRRSCRQNCRLG